MSRAMLEQNPRLGRWLVASAVMVSAIMELVDTSAVNVSLPYIAGNLSASVDEATWVLTSYLVSNAIVLPLSGWLASYFGRKKLLVIAVTGFTLASVCCGLAPTLLWLIVFRVFQGAAGGSLQPTTRAILLETFPPEERGQAMALFGVGIVVAPIIAPVLGGWLTTDYSWRWVFFLNLPVSILGLILVEAFVFDPPYLHRTSRRIDYWGVGMLVIGVATLQIMLDKGQEDDWFASHFIGTMAAVAVAGLIAFVVWELRAREPMVRLRLLRHRTFAVGSSFSLILFFGLYGSIVLIPLFMQTLLGFPAVTAGLWNAPRGIATMIAMPLAGFLIGRRCDMRAMIFCGLLVSAFGAWQFSLLNLDAGPWNFVIPELVMGAGLSILFVPLATITVDPIQPEEMGYATSLIAFSRNIGSAVGISILTAIVARREQFHQVRLTAHLAVNSVAWSGARSAFTRLLERQGAGPTIASQGALRILYQEVQRSATVLSYLDGFRIIAVLLALASPLVWLMRKPKSGSPRRPAE
jgi:MFS transporter, DHA2 family, multidrug resistance protein